jgi:hypothetical protein
MQVQLLCLAEKQFHVDQLVEEPLIKPFIVMV